MIEIPYFDKDGKPLPPVKFDETVFGDKVRRRLLKEAILMFENNQRQGTHKAKSRAEVSGTGAKPWRQKGTGRARAGRKQSPIWVGGGVAHPPIPRFYGYSMPRKKRQLALASAMLAKLKDGEVRLIEAVAFDGPKTKRAKSLLTAMGIAGKCVVGVAKHDANAYLSFRNIPRAQIAEVRNFNPHQVIGGGVIVLTKPALDELAANGAARAKAKEA